MFAGRQSPLRMLDAQPASFLGFWAIGSSEGSKTVANLSLAVLGKCCFFFFPSGGRAGGWAGCSCLLISTNYSFFATIPRVVE